MVAKVGRPSLIQGLRWRFESWRTGQPYAAVVTRHALLYRVEDVLWIQLGTGLLLAHAGQGELGPHEAAGIAGMITATAKFVEGAFELEAGAGLGTFSVGDTSVMIQYGERTCIAAVVRGEPPDEVRERLHSTVMALEDAHRDRLTRPIVDPGWFLEATPLLEKSLVTVLTFDAPTTQDGRAG